MRSCRVLGAGEPVGERRGTRERGWLRTVRRPGEGRGGREASQEGRPLLSSGARVWLGPVSSVFTKLLMLTPPHSQPSSQKSFFLLIHF